MGTNSEEQVLTILHMGIKASYVKESRNLLSLSPDVSTVLIIMVEASSER